MDKVGWHRRLNCVGDAVDAATRPRGRDGSVAPFVALFSGIGSPLSPRRGCQTRPRLAATPRSSCALPTRGRAWLSDV
eukprot:SAG31_NODE_1231_length_9212_cov_2.857566_11_plen_78_part_00